MHSPANDRLPEALESALSLVHERLVKIAQGENPEPDLRDLRAVLLNLRQIAGRNAAISAAVDEVFEAALSYQGEFAHAVKAGKDARYNFILLGAARMDRQADGLQTRYRRLKNLA